MASPSQERGAARHDLTVQRGPRGDAQAAVTAGKCPGTEGRPGLLHRPGTAPPAALASPSQQRALSPSSPTFSLCLKRSHRKKCLLLFSKCRNQMRAPRARTPGRRSCCAGATRVTWSQACPSGWGATGLHLQDKIPSQVGREVS